MHIKYEKFDGLYIWRGSVSVGFCMSNELFSGYQLDKQQ